DTVKDGVRSLWKGHKPTQSLPARRKCTCSPMISTMSTRAASSSHGMGPRVCTAMTSPLPLRARLQSGLGRGQKGGGNPERRTAHEMNSLPMTPCDGLGVTGFLPANPDLLFLPERQGRCRPGFLY